MKATPFFLSALACAVFAAPALSDPTGYPNGRGWQAVADDFDEVLDALDGLGGDFSGLSDQLEALQQSVDDVQDSIDAVVSVETESSPAFAVEGNDGEALVMARVEQMAMGIGGLIIDDFSMLSQQIVPAGCTAMAIDEVVPLGPAGSYALRLVPAVEGNFWCAGTYIATLSAETGAGSDGGLVKVVVPAAP